VVHENGGEAPPFDTWDPGPVQWEQPPPVNAWAPVSAPEPSAEGQIEPPDLLPDPPAPPVEPGVAAAEEGDGLSSP
jgi:hypothetical protein